MEDTLTLKVFMAETPETEEKQEVFKKELTSLINRLSIDNSLNTPDNILADYLYTCLCNFYSTVDRRDAWHGFQEFMKNETRGKCHQN